MISRVALPLLAFALFQACAFAEPVSLKGANGKVIDFDGVREAVPQGLWVRLAPGSDEMALPWDKLDPVALKTDHPQIFAALESARNGETTLLELGSYAREVIDLEIASAIEQVSEHAAAADHAAANGLGVLPYLYTTGGDEHPLPFRFYAPEKEFKAGDPKLPLIVWLHGAGSGGTDNLKNANLNLARKVIESGNESFMMFPQYHDEYNWWTYTSDNRGQCAGIPGRQILDLIDELCEKMPAVDPDRIYLLGMSQGGFGIPYLVTAYENRFAAQVLIAGMTTSVPWERGNAIPSWLFYSKDDKIMNQNGRDIGAAMADVLTGVIDEESVKVTVYEDAGHGGTLGRALDDPGLLDWLFAQKNENEPKRNSALVSEHFD